MPQPTHADFRASLGSPSLPRAPPLTPARLRAEGVVVAKKDYALKKHPGIDASNLEVIKLMTSLTSKELVTERFSWKHYYWFLTDEGIEYAAALQPWAAPRSLPSSARWWSRPGPAPQSPSHAPAQVPP